MTYLVFRNGRRIGQTRRLRYVDRGVKAGRTYHYAIRAVDPAGNRSRRPALVTVAVRGTGPTPTPTPTTTPTPATTLTTAMVDRLFWRAGFGPSPAERAAWTGKPVTALVDFLVSSPQSYDTTVPPPLTQSNGPIDPTASADELAMEWLYAMQTATNPLLERLTLFLHRHWCVSRLSGEITFALLIAYRDRLRRFADIAATPASSFRDLAFEMTTQDGAMSFFLNNFQNSKDRPNENYAREFMELFCLGVRNAAGQPNYAQADVSELAKAFTGWRINQNPGPGFGKITFTPSSYSTGAKTILGQTADFGADPAQGSGAQSAVDLVVNHPAHAPFLVKKLWSDFIVTPIPADALAALTTTYVSSGHQLKPLVKGILSHPLIFESLTEPNMVKPPIVYLVGQQRALRSPMRWFFQGEVLRNMQQCPYEAPNVAGWEGGLSWLNTNTVRARFDAALRTLHMRFNGTSGYPGSVPLDDIPGESGDALFDRVHSLAGSPWLSSAAQARIRSFAGAQPATSAQLRQQRNYAVLALVLGGPDTQVM